MLAPNRALMVGVPTLVGESIDATGTSDIRAFSVLKPPSSPGAVTFIPVGTFTAFDGTIEASPDGGTTWIPFAAFDFMVTLVLVLNLGSGINYRFNISNITQTVPPNILATLG